MSSKNKLHNDHLQIDMKKIKLHKELIGQYLKYKKYPASFEVINFCNPKDHTVIDLKAIHFPRSQTKEDGFISFTPAAGAASRYLEPLKSLLEYLYKNENLSQSMMKLIDDYPQLKYLLPPKEIMAQTDCKKILQHILIPKAFHISCAENITFLEAKLMELNLIKKIKTHTIVCSLNQKEAFLQSLKKSKINFTKQNITFIEQNASLSTSRILPSGDFLKHSDDTLSIVPAGHGSLVHLFDKVMKVSQNQHSMFISNLDNLFGFNEDFEDISNHFLDFHEFLLKTVKKIRSHLEQSQLSQAAIKAHELLEYLPHDIHTQKEIKKFLTSRPRVEEKLWLVLFKLFHAPIPSQKNENLLNLFNKPLVTMAQIENTKKDVGGVPVIAKTPFGIVKMCLEQVHIDKKSLENNTLSQNYSYFNPAYLALEMNHLEKYCKDDHPFWIVAKKQYQNKTSYHYESLLYEILGNSFFSHLVFVKLPRSIFNPHKNIDDTFGNKLPKKFHPLYTKNSVQNI